MNVRRAVVGDSWRSAGLGGALVLLAVAASFGYLFLIGAIESFVPSALVLASFAVLPVFATGVVAVCTYRGQAILFGWLVGAAVFYAPFFVLVYDAVRKTGQGTLLDPILAGTVWSLVASFVFCLVGVVIGGALRLVPRRTQWM
ncbi:hypothetical protein [Halovivax gelatinilyticus]|uniref:hypothetical protein n=1 Tax=Halovivax gelatinilyticus TaxID=2961597 RepID=UPI0020CA4044|nr:hypothetical protein [Halovivax gelatinilyticus]